MKIGFWDIERCSMISRHYERFGNFSIRPEQTIRDERTVSFAWRWLGQPKSKTVYFAEWTDGGRERMLQEAYDRIAEADALVSWNGKRFDTRAINRDFFLAGMPTPPEPKEIDLMAAVKRRMFFSSNSLKNVARELGIVGKTEVGSLDQLTEDAMAGDEKAQRLHKRYNKQDVDLLADELYPRLLPWIPASMHPNVAIGEDFACPRCGGTRLEKRGLFRTSSGIYQRYHCLTPGCGAWPRGSRRLDTTELR